MAVADRVDSMPHRSVLLIRVEAIAFSPTNARARMDDASLRELTESVRQHGVLQPVLVRPVVTSPDHSYELVCGHRRLAAARLAGLAEIPATVRELEDAEALEIQVIENVERADLHPLDEARGYERLITVHKYDAQRIADRIGRSARYVHDRVKLLQLIPALQKLFLEGRITAGHAVVLARLKPGDQKRAADEDKGGLWEHEALLWDPSKSEFSGPHETLKTRTVGELQGWIDEHVRFDPKAADPVLFEPTISELERARKVIPITREYVVQPEAKGDGSRTYGPRAWKRADGQPEGGKASKTCEHSITGFVAVGPGRGEAFAVCIAREKCQIHWGTEMREKKQRAARSEAVGRKPAAAARPDEWEINRAGREAVDEAWEKAMPALRVAAAKAKPEQMLRLIAGDRNPWQIAQALREMGVKVKNLKPDAWAKKAPLAQIQSVLISTLNPSTEFFGVLGVKAPDFRTIERDARAKFVAEWKAKHAPAAKAEKPPRPRPGRKKK